MLSRYSSISYLTNFQNAAFLIDVAIYNDTDVRCQQFTTNDPFKDFSRKATYVYSTRCMFVS